LRPNDRYDPLRDLVPVSLTFKTDHVVVVANKVQARTLADLLALLKRAPGTLAYGSAGIGTTSHVIAELFKAKAGVNMRHVPYRGAGPALNDLVAGHIDAMVDSLANALPQIQAGNVRALAVTGKARHPALPDVPTVAETGIAFDAFAWGALLAPRGTPADVIERLSREVRAVYADAATVARLAAVGADAIACTPAELAAFMQADTAQWERVIRDVGIRLE
jgi:tripartite-type tricarboxylate transporter receptor subunit TctC